MRYRPDKDDNKTKQRAYMSGWRKAHPRKNDANARKSHLKVSYDLSIEEYDALLLQQDNVCAICKKKCKRFTHLSVDHNHSTGKIRGLLCNDCNIAIGRMKEDPVILRAAADYIERDKELVVA